MMDERDESVGDDFRKEDSQEQPSEREGMQAFEHLPLNPEDFTNLSDFMDWVFSSEGPRLNARIPILSRTKFLNGVCSVILGRWKNFQIEQLIFDANFKGRYCSQKERERIAVSLSGCMALSFGERGSVSNEGPYDSFLQRLELEKDNIRVADCSMEFFRNRLPLPSAVVVSFEIKERGGVALVFEKIRDGEEHSSILEDFQN